MDRALLSDIAYEGSHARFETRVNCVNNLQDVTVQLPQVPDGDDVEWTAGVGDVTSRAVCKHRQFDSFTIEASFLPPQKLFLTPGEHVRVTVSCAFKKKGQTESVRVVDAEVTVPPIAEWRGASVIAMLELHSHPILLVLTGVQVIGEPCPRLGSMYVHATLKDME
jgi:hypothetical protein